MTTNLVITSSIFLCFIFIAATFQFIFYIINLKHKSYNDMFIIITFILSQYVQIIACSLFYCENSLILELFILESLLQILPTLQMLFNYFPKDINKFIPMLISTPYVLSIFVSLFRYFISNQLYKWLNQINIATGQVFTILLNSLIILVIFKQKICKQNVFMLLQQSGSIVQQLTFLMLILDIITESNFFVISQIFRNVSHFVSMTSFIYCERKQYKMHQK